MPYFLDVVLPIPVERLFTYKITEEQRVAITQGMRVAVPFGKSKIYTALAYQVHEKPPTAYEAKEIHALLDTAPIVTPSQLKHWQWIAEYYMCTLGEVLRAAIPGLFLLESETDIVAGALEDLDEAQLTDDEFLIIEALHHQPLLKIKDVVAITGRKRVMPLIHGLVAKGALALHERIQEKYKPKTIKYLKLAAAYEGDESLNELMGALSRAPKQSQAILSYFHLQGGTKKPIKKSALEKEGAVSNAVLKALITKGILEEYALQTDRVVYENNDSEVADLQLNEAQKEATEQIEASFAHNKVCLLHGVTSSGKTAIYIKQIKKLLDEGKQVLYLVPEIALTSQLINRLKAYFGNEIAVYHSRYSQQERVEVWKNVLNNSANAKIVLGARSSLFLPFQDLGLIIIDEEHEASFKQFDPAPRYHARDAAIVLAQFQEAFCLLGSATPSIESYTNVITGKYGLAEITKRFGNVLMPEIALVDLKEAYRKKRMQGHFSETLQLAMQEALAEGEQIILFQNRRGFAPVLECTTCGHVSQCPNCDVSLTLHQKRNQLRCHYCGYHIPIVKACQACGNSTLDTKGFGTEQVQKELEELFPEKTVGRMDLDTTRGKYAYEKLIGAFEAHEIDILVGTQMITKGLDFRNVGLVGIMNADSLLNFPDYRAHERSYQLLVQVAGRAGRTEKRGKVLIQTYNPYHQVLQQVSTYEYQQFFKDQRYEREQFHYPPQTRIVQITFKGRDYTTTQEASAWFASSLRNVLDGIVLGPESPLIARIRNQYIRQVLVKFSKKTSVLKAKKSIKRVEQSFDAISKFKSVRVYYDVDHI